MFDLVNVFGKGSGGEGEEKHEKNESSKQLSPPIKRCNVIHWRWMPKAEDDDEDEKEEPSRIVKYCDKGHRNNSDQINGTTPSSKQAIDDVASVELSYWKEIKGSYKESNPSSKSDGVEQDLIILCILTQHQTL